MLGGIFSYLGWHFSNRWHFCLCNVFGVDLVSFLLQFASKHAINLGFFWQCGKFQQVDGCEREPILPSSGNFLCVSFCHDFVSIGVVMTSMLFRHPKL